MPRLTAGVLFALALGVPACTDASNPYRPRSPDDPTCDLVEPNSGLATARTTTRVNSFVCPPPLTDPDPALIAEVDLSSPSNPYGARYISVHYDEKGGVYRMWHLVERKRPAKELFYAESVDGITFRDVGVAFTVPGKSLYGATVSFVPHLDQYVLAYAAHVDYGANFIGDGWENGIALSDDGLTWKTLPGAEYRPSNNLSDSPTQVVWNERTQAFQMMVRPRVGDRQVAIIQSADLKSWSEPQLIFPKYQTSDIQVQFYGMTTFHTAWGWRGLVLRMETPVEKLGYPYGRYQTYLATSEDGITWQLDESGPFLPVIESGGCGPYTRPLAWQFCPAFSVNRGDGAYGTGGVEATSMISMPDGSVRIFASGFLVDHSLLTVQQASGTPATNLLVYETTDLDRPPTRGRRTAAGVGGAEETLRDGSSEP